MRGGEQGGEEGQGRQRQAVASIWGRGAACRVAFAGSQEPFPRGWAFPCVAPRAKVERVPRNSARPWQSGAGLDSPWAVMGTLAWRMPRAALLLLAPTCRGS